MLPYYRILKIIYDLLSKNDCKLAYKITVPSVCDIFYSFSSFFLFLKAIVKHQQKF